MQTFDFPYYRHSDKYPESSVTMKFGRGYQFASKPKGPDQIICELEYPHMFWMQDPITNEFRDDVNLQLNIKALISFYEAHRLYEKFWFDHPTRGVTVWRFNKPLETPKRIGDNAVFGINGYLAHQVDGFSVELILQPT